MVPSSGFATQTLLSAITMSSAPAPTSTEPSVDGESAATRQSLPSEGEVTQTSESPTAMAATEVAGTLVRSSTLPVASSSFATAPSSPSAQTPATPAATAPTRNGPQDRRDLGAREVDPRQGEIGSDGPEGARADGEMVRDEAGGRPAGAWQRDLGALRARRRVEPGDGQCHRSDERVRRDAAAVSDPDRLATDREVGRRGACGKRLDRSLLRIDAQDGARVRVEDPEGARSRRRGRWCRAHVQSALDLPRPSVQREQNTAGERCDTRLGPECEHPDGDDGRDEDGQPARKRGDCAPPTAPPDAPTLRGGGSSAGSWPRIAC